MRLKREVDDLDDLLDRQHLLIDWLQSDGAARDAEITQLPQGLAVAAGENEALRAELTATRGFLEEQLNAQDSEVQELRDIMPDAGRGRSFGSCARSSSSLTSGRTGVGTASGCSRLRSFLIGGRLWRATRSAN
jgi:hypothetical protein